jgi:hypothetical protein
MPDYTPIGGIPLDGILLVRREVRMADLNRGLEAAAKKFPSKAALAKLDKIKAASEGLKKQIGDLKTFLSKAGGWAGDLDDLLKEYKKIEGLVEDVEASIKAAADYEITGVL